MTGRPVNVAVSLVDFACGRRASSRVPRQAGKWPVAVPAGLYPGIGTPSVERNPRSGDEGRLS
ncbi:hypothetical protein LGN17_26780 [Burkholderia sp. AU30280]|nr:hypothetical protein [Burkholderia sp. AU30280]